MQYLVTFLEGIITFISPCILPMLPIYISYFAAGEQEKKRTLVNAIGFVVGFSVIFVTLGALAGTIGGFLVRFATAVNITAGAIVIVLGLNFLGVIKIGFLNRSSGKSPGTKNLNFFKSSVFGMAFSAGCSMCVGAFLGSALMRAGVGGDPLGGSFMLLLYSLGLGIPFILSAVLIDKLKGAFDFIKRNYRMVNIISGCILIVMGILLATGLMGRLFR